MDVSSAHESHEVGVVHFPRRLLDDWHGDGDGPCHAAPGDLRDSERWPLATEHLAFAFSSLSWKGTRPRNFGICSFTFSLQVTLANAQASWG